MISPVPTRWILCMGLALASAAGALRAGDLDFVEHRFPVGGRIDGRILEDLDGDGRLDLVLLEGRRVVLFLQGPEGFRRWPNQVFMLDASVPAMVTLELDTLRPN